MSDQKEWKSKYQASLRELDKKELDWQKIEAILRKVIARLAIAGKGQNNQVDRQLEQIRKLSKNKSDLDLEQALKKLTELLKHTDATQNTTSLTRQKQPDKAVATLDTIKILTHLIQKISFPDKLGADIKTRCAITLKEASKGDSRTALTDFVGYLAQLINENSIVLEQKHPKNKNLIELLEILELDLEKTQSEQNIELSGELKSTELQQLADLLKFNHESSTSATEIITALIDHLAIIPELQKRCKSLRKSLVGSTTPPQSTIFKELVSAVSAAIDIHRQGRQALAKFIKHVSTELSGVTSAIGEQNVNEMDSFEDITELGIMMRKSVTAFQQDVEQEGDISQLKKLIEKNINSIKSGVDDFVSKSGERHSDTEHRNNNLINRLNKMEKETEDLKQELAENRDKLLHDSLTGLYSRLAYDEYLLQELQRWQRYDNLFSYAILDIDHFKRVNDKYGHNAGDNALKIVAQILQKKIRGSDRLFRIGGEEFVLILTNHGKQQSAQIVEDLRNHVSKSPFHFKKKLVSLTLSVGLTEVRAGDTVESLYERADKALYEAKNNGRNKMVVAD